MEPTRGKLDATGKRFAIVASRWNESIVEELVAGSLEAFAQHGNPDVELISVPGAWEIPVAIKALIGSRRPDGIVALGCVLQGQTSHAQLLGADVSRALMSLQVETGIPIAWGILTPDSPEQAMERAVRTLGNKGREVTLAAIEMANLAAEIR